MQWIWRSFEYDRPKQNMFYYQRNNFIRHFSIIYATSEIIEKLNYGKHDA